MKDTTREVITALGGAAELGRILGVGATAVSNWAVTNVFPARTYKAIKALMRTAGIDAPDTLWTFIDVKKRKGHSTGTPKSKRGTP